MTERDQQVYQQLCDHVRQTTLLKTAEGLLDWDDRCYMPPAAGEYRAEQTTYLAGLVHQRKTDPRLGDWLGELETSALVSPASSAEATNIRQLRREYNKAVKLPQSLVEEITRTATLGQQVWQEARRKNDFASFQPLLARMVELKRQQAEAQGYPEQPYDALLDDYEPNARTRQVADVLGALRDELQPLVARIVESDRQLPAEIVHRHYPIATQRTFGRAAAEMIGFDFARGRLDETAHPFCTTLGPHDCRITTRYDDHHFNGGFFGILHEVGHGLYEQGLPAEQHGLPAGDAVSLGIHESQSRMWENLVGRSLPFWKHLFPAARAAYPEALGDVDVEQFYAAVNDVRPSLIRVEADEATYNLHIMIRFELELELINGNLPVGDLPAAWNTRYCDYLGLTPATDAEGVLQDIHWSAGLFGYFATYTLGNLHAAHFFRAADHALAGVEQQFARGEFRPLLDWLRAHIHCQGQTYTADDLAQRVANQPLSHEHLIGYLRKKFEPLYGI